MTKFSMHYYSSATAALTRAAIELDIQSDRQDEGKPAHLGNLAAMLDCLHENLHKLGCDLDLVKIEDKQPLHPEG